MHTIEWAKSLNTHNRPKNGKLSVKMICCGFTGYYVCMLAKLTGCWLELYIYHTDMIKKWSSNSL